MKEPRKKWCKDGSPTVAYNRWLDYCDLMRRVRIYELLTKGGKISYKVKA